MTGSTKGCTAVMTRVSSEKGMRLNFEAQMSFFVIAASKEVLIDDKGIDGVGKGLLALQDYEQDESRQNKLQAYIGNIPIYMVCIVK
jgi:hypothetical protein